MFIKKKVFLMFFLLSFFILIQGVYGFDFLVQACNHHDYECNHESDLHIHYNDNHECDHHYEIQDCCHNYCKQDFEECFNFEEDCCNSLDCCDYNCENIEENYNALIFISSDDNSENGCNPHDWQRVSGSTEYGNNDLFHWESWDVECSNCGKKNAMQGTHYKHVCPEADISREYNSLYHWDQQNFKECTTYYCDHTIDPKIIEDTKKPHSPVAIPGTGSPQTGNHGYQVSCRVETECSGCDYTGTPSTYKYHSPGTKCAYCGVTLEVPEDEISDLQEDFEQLYEENLKRELGEYLEWIEENKEDLSGVVGDPVQYTTGNYVSRSIDLSLNNSIIDIEIIRNYSNANQRSFSFGQGWNFNYDTRIIMGISRNYEERKEEFTRIADEISDLYNMAKEVDENTNYDLDIDFIEQSYEEALNSANNAMKEAEFSSVFEERNKYSLDNNIESQRDKTGVGKLIFINEKGVPQTYRIIEEPDYDSEIFLADGNKNYFPNGSKTEADDPQADELEILKDGSYKLTRKDQTVYYYSYLGKLEKIQDTNGNYLIFEYNLSQELQKIVSSNGLEVKIEVSAGKIRKITDPIGRTHSYNYSGNRLTSYTDPEGNTRRYKYNKYGLSELIYPDGSGWEYFYTEVDGRTVMDYQIDSSGAVMAYEYDFESQETTFINRNGNKTIYRYNDNHLTVEEIDAEYNRIYRTYDDNNNLVTEANKRGYIKHFTYDANNNLTSITDPVGTSSFTYNQFNKISSNTDKSGYTTNYIYDHKGNLTAIQYPDGSSKSFVYNEIGLLIAEIDQRGNRIEFKYDQYGNLEEKIYPDGSIERYEYDKIGRLLKTIKPNEAEIKYTYDNNDNLIEIVDELGNEELFKYDSRNNIIERIDANGNITSYEYDERNNLSKIIDPAGNEEEIFYDEAENMKKKILAKNVSYIYEYDPLNRLISTVQVESDIETRYQYDSTDNLIALTDGEGRTTKYEYDLINRKIKEIDPLNNSVRYNYNENDLLKSIIDKEGNITHFKYDSMGRTTEIIDALNQRVRYEYDAAGNKIKQIDARGNAKEFEYDSRNRLIKEIDAQGNEIKYQYDEVGNLISNTDSEGNVTNYEYDIKGRLIREKNSLGDSKYYQYDPVGNLISQTNEAGITTQYRYDELNRLVEIEDVLGNITQIGYNQLDSIAWQEDALGNRVEFVYDSANRLIKEIDAAGNSIEFTYDKAGNLIEVKDEMGYITKYNYDELNRMIEEIDALNNSVSYTYDANGNLIEMTNRNGNNYQYEYDALGRLVKEINYLGDEQNFRYDPNNNLIEQIDYNSNKTNYNYDELNRLLQVVFADGNNNEFSYDSRGLMTTAVNDNSQQKYHYDQLARLIKVEVENENDQYTVEYQYNELGQRTKVSLDDGGILKERVTEYFYDEASRLKELAFADGKVVKYRYDELNRVINQINSNNTGSEYSYTPNGQLETISHFTGLNNYNSNVIESYGYIYNQRNQRIMEVEGSGEVTTYKYDPVGKLTKVYYLFSGAKKESNRHERAYYGLETNLDYTDEYYRKSTNPDQYISDKIYQLRSEVENLHRDIRESGKSLDLYSNGYYIEEYNYDPAGNMIQEVNAWGSIDYQYNEANQLIQAGNREFHYDANGNLLREGYDGNYAEYQYNYENRLTKVSNLSNNHKLFAGEHPFTGTIEYSYDALNRRISKELTPGDGGRIEISGYYYDGRSHNELAEYQDEVWNIQEYRKGKKDSPTNIPGGQIKYFNEYYYGNGLAAYNTIKDPNPWHMNSELYFYHKDGLGSMRVVSDNYGNVSENYSYSVYGNPYEGRFRTTQNNNPYGFTGQRFEAETWMYSFAYRTYNPVSKRWMTPDPIRDGMNWYQYVSCDPVNFWDPYGLWWERPLEILDGVLQVAGGGVQFIGGMGIVGGSGVAKAGTLGASTPITLWTGVAGAGLAYHGVGNVQEGLGKLRGIEDPSNITRDGYETAGGAIGGVFGKEEEGSFVGRHLYSAVDIGLNIKGSKGKYAELQSIRQKNAPFPHIKPSINAGEWYLELQPRRVLNQISTTGHKMGLASDVLGYGIKGYEWSSSFIKPEIIDYMKGDYIKSEG
ncbi:RHS repeat-associated core domain-containing protein [Natronospora cellulosivora (SeqCode)]